MSLIEQVPLTHRTLEEYAYDAIKRAVIQQTLKPGEKFTLKELEDRLDISRTPIRQALRRLAQEGFMTLDPHSVTKVKPLDADEARELYRIRTRLEGLALEEATKKITLEELAEIKDLLDQMEQVTKGGNVEEILALNRQFHGMVYTPCRMPRLLSIIADLRGLCERYRWVAGQKKHRLDIALKEHWALYKAMEANDPQRAAEIIVKHMEGTAETITQVLETNDVRSNLG